MAEIRQYVSNESPYGDIGGRRAVASDFGISADFAGAAQDINAAANKLLQAQEERDVSDVHVKLSEARAKWTKELLNRSQTDDVYSPDFADKFTTQLHDDIAQLGDGVSTAAGQRAFRQGVADMTASFSGSAGVYQAQAAGVKAKNDYQTYINNNQLTLFHDPNQFGSVMAEAQRALDDPAGPYAKLQPSVKQALARTGANSLADSAMRGLINLDPVRAKKELEAGVDPIVKSLDADTMSALMAHADQGINAIRIEQERQDALARRQKNDAQNETLNGIINKLAEDQDAGRPPSVSTKDVVNSNLDPNQRIAVLNWIQKGLTGDKGDTARYDATFNDYWTRIHLPDGDPDKITDPALMDQAVSNDMLDFPRLQVLRSEIAGKGAAATAEKSLTDAFDNLAEKSLVVKDPITGFLDPNDQEGNRLLYQFRAWFATEYQKRRDGGKTPEQLLTPGSPDYMGTMIDTLRAQRKSLPGLPTGPGGLLAPDAGTPGVTSPAAETKTINGVTYTKGADGKWYK